MTMRHLLLDHHRPRLAPPSDSAGSSVASSAGSPAGFRPLPMPRGPSANASGRQARAQAATRRNQSSTPAFRDGTNPMFHSTPTSPSQREATTCSGSRSRRRSRVRSRNSPSGRRQKLVAAEALLDVVLFDVSGPPVVIAGSDEGRLKLLPDGSAIVVRQPSGQAGPLASAALLARRLLFPLRQPTEPGEMRFRCNLYHSGVLIQSRLVRCEVRRATGAQPRCDPFSVGLPARAHIGSGPACRSTTTRAQCPCQ